MAIIRYVPPNVPIKDYRNDKGGYYIAKCDICGREFYPKRKSGRYCSEPCLRKAELILREPKPKEPKKAEKTVIVPKKTKKKATEPKQKVKIPKQEVIKSKIPDKNDKVAYAEYVKAEVERKKALKKAKYLIPYITAEQLRANFLKVKEPDQHKFVDSFIKDVQALKIGEQTAWLHEYNGECGHIKREDMDNDFSIVRSGYNG